MSSTTTTTELGNYERILDRILDTIQQAKSNPFLQKQLHNYVPKIRIFQENLLDEMEYLESLQVYLSLTKEEKKNMLLDVDDDLDDVDDDEDEDDTDKQNEMQTIEDRIQTIQNQLSILSFVCH